MASENATAVVVLDFETTGLSAAGGDRVVEVGLVRLGRDLKVEREFGTLVNPGRPVGATRIHGITDADVAEAPTFGEIAGDIGELLEGAVLAGHNADFDIRFLWREFERAGLGSRLPSAFPLPFVDTMELARRFLPQIKNYQLGTVCAACGIEARGLHGALGDARMTAQLLTRLAEVGGEALVEEVFLADDVPRPGWAGQPAGGRLLPRKTLATLGTASATNAIPAKMPAPLTGEVAVITGGTGITRDEAVRVAEMLGCTVRNAITGQTTIAVVGDPGGGRWAQGEMDMTAKHRMALEKKAAGQPIRILTVSEFLVLAEVCSDGVITDKEWASVRELVYGPEHAKVPQKTSPKTRSRRAVGEGEAQPRAKTSARASVRPAPFTVCDSRGVVDEEAILLDDEAEWPCARFLQEHATVPVRDIPAFTDEFAAMFVKDAQGSLKEVLALGDTPPVGALLEALARHIDGFDSLVSAAEAFLTESSMPIKPKGVLACTLSEAVTVQLTAAGNVCASIASAASGRQADEARRLVAQIERIIDAVRIKP